MINHELGRFSSSNTLTHRVHTAALHSLSAHRLITPECGLVPREYSKLTPRGTSPHSGVMRRWADRLCRAAVFSLWVKVFEEEKRPNSCY